MTSLKNTFNISSASSHSQVTLQFCKFLYFLFVTNKLHNLKVAVTTLPKQIKKYTFLKSPHIYKKARTQLEIRQIKTLVTVTNFTEKSTQECSRALNLMVKQIPTGIKVTIKRNKLMYIS